MNDFPKFSSSPSGYTKGDRVFVPSPIYRKWWQFWKPRIVGSVTKEYLCVGSSVGKITVDNPSVESPEWMEIVPGKGIPVKATSNESLETRLLRAMTGSCTCKTKNRGPSHHAPLCHYRLFSEAYVVITTHLEKADHERLWKAPDRG